MNRNCNICNIKLDESNYLKYRTVCQNCYNKNRRQNKYKSTLIQNQQPKLGNNNDSDNKHRVSAYENLAYVIIDPETLAKLITCRKYLKN